MAAGETPMTENGAASVARMTPHEFRPLKPKLSRMTATAAMAAPAQSMVMSFCGGTGLTPEAQDQVDHRESHDEGERVSPPDRRREGTGDEQRQHTGRRDCCCQVTDGLCLLIATEVRGDEDRQRGSDEGDHGAGCSLRHEQHCRALTQGDHGHCEAVNRDGNLEDQTRSVTGADLGPQQNEGSHGEGARGDRGADTCCGRVEIGGDAGHRDGQGVDGERRLNLGEDHHDEW